MFFAPKEDHTDHAHGEGEEEGLGADLAKVQEWGAEIDALGMSDDAADSEFHWADVV
jgi:hypothetical protein